MNDSPTAVVHAKGLRKDYGSGEGMVRALDAVDLDVDRGEAVAVMGEEKDSDAALLLEGIVLRLQADLRWLQACEIAWTKRSTPK